MAAGENHHHERRADRQWRDYTRTRADNRAANCQDQEERSDKFGDILVHKSFLTRHTVKKARQISNKTLVLSTNSWEQIPKNLVLMWISSIWSQ
jgi:hypothetical protein